MAKALLPRYTRPKRLKSGATAYFWSPPSWAKKRGCGLHAEPLGELADRLSERFISARELTARSNYKLVRLIMGVVGVIVVTCAALTWFGKIGDGGFTFLAGVVVGYLLTFAQRLFTPSE